MDTSAPIYNAAEQPTPSPRLTLHGCKAAQEFLRFHFRDLLDRRPLGKPMIELRDKISGLLSLLHKAITEEEQHAS